MSTLKVPAKIISMITRQMKANTNNHYKQVLRSLINTFGNLYYIDGNGAKVKIKCSSGRMERNKGKDYQDNTLILPYISIYERGSSNDDNRRRYTPVLVNEVEWDAKEQRAKRYLSLAPRPVIIDYDINIWTKFVEDMDIVRSTILSMFNPDLEIETQDNEYIKAFLVSEDDIDSEEQNDKADRVIKKKISISVETYIRSPKILYTNTSQINTQNYEVSVQSKQSTTESISNKISPNNQQSLPIAPEDENDAELYIILGDSLALGQGFFASSLYGTEFSSVANSPLIGDYSNSIDKSYIYRFVAYPENKSTYSQPTFEKIVPGLNTCYFGDFGITEPIARNLLHLTNIGDGGVESVLAYKLKDTSNFNKYFIKFPRAGSYALSGTNLSWSPRSGTIWNDYVTKMNNAIDILKSSYKNVIVKSVIVFLGSNKPSYVEDTDLTSENLNIDIHTLNSNIFNNLISYGLNIPANAKFVLAGPPLKDTAYGEREYQYREEYISKLTYYDSLSTNIVYYAMPTSSDLFIDDYHYTSEGYINIASDLFDILQS